VEAAVARVRPSVSVDKFRLKLPSSARATTAGCSGLGSVVVGFIVDLLGAHNGQVIGPRTAFSRAELSRASRPGVRVVGVHGCTRRIMNPEAENWSNEGDDLIFSLLPNIREFSPWLNAARN
jgi:hypothetical protein